MKELDNQALFYLTSGLDNPPAKPMLRGIYEGDGFSGKPLQVRGDQLFILLRGKEVPVGIDICVTEDSAHRLTGASISVLEEPDLGKRTSALISGNLDGQSFSEVSLKRDSMGRPYIMVGESTVFIKFTVNLPNESEDV